MKKTTLSILVTLCLTAANNPSMAESHSQNSDTSAASAACEGAKALFKVQSKRAATNCSTVLVKSEANLHHYLVQTSIQQVNDFNENQILESKQYLVQVLNNTVTFISDSK